MKWKYETSEQLSNRLSNWKSWFAWYPVSIEGTRYWLEKIERRDFIYITIRSHNLWVTEYRELKLTKELK